MPKMVQLQIESIVRICAFVKLGVIRFFVYETP